MYDDEYEDENAEHMRYYQYQERRHQKALNSYPEGEKHVNCDQCGALLTFNSMNYQSGYCIDGCDD